MPAVNKARGRGLYTRVRYNNDKNSMRNVSSKGKQEQMDAQAVLLATARVGTLMGSTRVRDEEILLSRI